MIGFSGTVETFLTTAAADVTYNSVITAGALIGVAHKAYALGETVVAYLGTPHNRYTFACTALASAQTQGAKVYLTPGGAVSFTSSGNTYFGILYTAAASGATEVDVILL